MAAGWVYVGVNMRDDDHRRLEQLAELWGMSKAATVRRLLEEATREFDDRNGHTCPEGQFAKWGTSNPFRLPRCTVCWPTMPTQAERHDAERVQAMATTLAGGHVVSPWWFHVAEARNAEDAESRT